MLSLELSLVLRDFVYLRNISFLFMLLLLLLLFSIKITILKIWMLNCFWYSIEKLLHYLYCEDVVKLKKKKTQYLESGKHTTYNNRCNSCWEECNIDIALYSKHIKYPTTMATMQCTSLTNITFNNMIIKLTTSTTIATATATATAN